MRGTSAVAVQTRTQAARAHGGRGFSKRAKRLRRNMSLASCERSFQPSAAVKKETVVLPEQPSDRDDMRGRNPQNARRPPIAEAAGDNNDRRYKQTQDAE